MCGAGHNDLGNISTTTYNSVAKFVLRGHGKEKINNTPIHPHTKIISHPFHVAHEVNTYYEHDEIRVDGVEEEEEYEECSLSE